jgi:dipeptidyl-peptidase-4
MFVRKCLSVMAVVVMGCCLTASGAAQGKQLTTEDYARAEKFMGYNVNSLVYHGVARPAWMGDGRFWYRDNGPDGVTFMVVDPVKRTKTPAFDQVKLAAALTAATGGRMKAEAQHLVISEISFSDEDKTVIVGNGPRKFRCDLSGAGVCSEVIAAGAKPAGAEQPAGRARTATDVSPDKTKAAFIRNWNLCVRDLATGKETQLTTDGVKDYGYATDNAGWQMSDNPILVWSPDSKKIATFQQDQRKDVTMIERVIIEVDGAKMIRLKMPPDQHRSTLCDDVSCRGGSGWDDVQWSDDGAHLAFVSTSRDHKQEWMRIADASTGEVRDVMGETTAKFYESGNDKVNWKYLSKTNELLWFSEKDNWGQMYLYDIASGKLKNQITHGEGNVTQVLHVDEKTRTIYFLGVGKEAGRDPYFQHYYSIKFDGKDMKLLTPENADHAVTSSPDGSSFVDVYSTVTQPETAVVRDDIGKVIVDVAKQDITKLVAAGWVPPVPITVKGRDGKTDVYGFIFKPTSFDASKKYPIVNHVYPGPQTGSCGGRGFAAAHGDMQSLAELGFVVVCIDGMGTPWRSKAFHEAYYANLGDNTLPDQVSGMKDLAAKYSWINLDKVGIYGHSGGGNATGAAMFHYPDFFKVGIAESGNHDQRDYEDDWAEKWAGLEVKNADGTSNYDSQANQNFVKNLKGKLLLAHGSMDNNVPLNNTLLVVEALIKANKDFDLLIIPNVAHGYGEATQYMTRRRWDYFVKNLAGDVPPHEYEMKSYASVMAAMRGGPSDGDDEYDGQ